MIKNLPALPMRDQIKDLLSILAVSLENDVIPEGKRRAGLRDNWEQIEKENEARQELALSIVFGGRPTAAFIGSDFWVYCNDLSDTKTVKAIATAYGYSNFETFAPKTGHPEDKTISIADPRGAYAVRVCSSSGLIFGDHAEKWLELHSHLINIVSDHITYTYCHNTDARFTFQTKEAAQVFYTGLLHHYSRMQEEASIRCKRAPDMAITIEPHRLCINSWVVNLDFDRSALAA